MIDIPNNEFGNSDNPDSPTHGVGEPRRSRIWTCFAYPLIGVVLAIVFQAIQAAILAAIFVSQGVKPSDLGVKILNRIMEPDAFIVMLVLGQLAFFLATIVPAFCSSESMKERFGYRPVKNSIRVYGLTMMGSIFVLTLAIGLVYLVALVIPPDESFMKLFENMTPGWGVVFVLLIAFLPGFIEESMFRGYIQQRFMKRWSPLLAIGVTSLLFALVHITPHGIAVAFPLGVWFGIIAWRTKSIGPCIACHAFVNGGLNLWRLIVKFAKLNEMTQNVFHGVFIVLGLVAFVMACRMLINYEASNPIPAAAPKGIG